MMAKIMNNLGNKVTYSTQNWEQLVVRAWGAEWNSPDHRVYKFSGGRNFDSTDMNNTGIYNAALGVNYLKLDTNYPDTTSNNSLLQLSGGKIIKNG
jgi:hypothetical protein